MSQHVGNKSVTIPYEGSVPSHSYKCSLITCSSARMRVAVVAKQLSMAYEIYTFLTNDLTVQEHRDLESRGS